MTQNDVALYYFVKHNLKKILLNTSFHFQIISRPFWSPINNKKHSLQYITNVFGYPILIRFISKKFKCSHIQ
jgi:hypothetical protein